MCIVFLPTVFILVRLKVKLCTVIIICMDKNINKLLDLGHVSKSKEMILWVTFSGVGSSEFSKMQFFSICLMVTSIKF